MLVINRKPGQSVKIIPNVDLDPATPIGELFSRGPITIQIVHSSGNQIKIGIDADARFNIYREELNGGSSHRGEPS